MQQQTYWGQQKTHQKVMTNMLKKVFNWSEVHLSEVTSHKIHALISEQRVHISTNVLRLQEVEAGTR